MKKKEPETIQEKEKKEKAKLALKFGKELKALRFRKGMTSLEVSSNCNLEKSNYLTLERGKVTPTIFTVKKIAQAFGMPFSEFIKELGLDEE